MDIERSLQELWSINNAWIIKYTGPPINRPSIQNDELGIFIEATTLEDVVRKAWLLVFMHKGEDNAR